jgi:hypothetical protein
MSNEPYIAVIAAGLMPALLGYLWYHPRFFGAAWVRMMRITPEMAERGQRTRALFSFVSFAAGFAAALAVYFVVQVSGISDVPRAMVVATLLWAGCVVPSSLGDVVWEQKPLKLYAIDAGYWLASFLLMGALVGLVV